MSKCLGWQTLLAVVSLQGAEFGGKVTDTSGAAISGAKVALVTAGGTQVAETRTAADGTFQLPVETGILRVHAPGFETYESAMSAGTASRVITLGLAGPATRVTVTALRGHAAEPETSPELLYVAPREQAAASPAPTIGHWLANAPGVMIQQSSTSQVSPFLRGLTGYHVVNLVDGVRFNNSTFRSGPNQYLAFVEPSQAQRIESMLGPSGVQYGSDSLGGTIHVVTGAPRYSGAGRMETHGEAMVFGASADRSAGGNAEVSLGTARLALLVGGTARRHGDLRAGGGLDSRNAFHRFFGLTRTEVRELTGARLADTDFQQYGGHGKLAVRPAADQSLTFWYQHSQQDNAQGYKDLLGGLGRLESAFEPQSLHFFYGRYEKVAVGPLDTASGTFSVNEQRDGSRRRNLNLSDPLTVDWNRVRSYGYSGQGTVHAARRVSAAFGADVYDERVDSLRTIDGLSARPLYPDNSKYLTGGIFAQGIVQLPRGLRVGLGSRFTHIGYDDRTFRDWTWNASVSWDATQWLGVHFLSGRGFRAPNLNDLGATGLNDLGYEIPAESVLDSGALMGDSAGENALSLGRPIGRLRSESLLNYEAGLRVTRGGVSFRAQLFTAGLNDPIVRRTLLFPAANLPSSLAGLPVTRIAPTSGQISQGVVTVATAFDPRAVKAFVNDGQSRYSGVETVMRWTMGRSWWTEAGYSFLAGRDEYPNRPIRRLPPQMASARMRYTAPRRGYWIELAGAAAGAQKRLSGGDRDDERIGASRSRNDIAAFYRGARVARLLDDAGRFQPTGETLREIQDRVLPGVADGVRVPLYASTAGWAAAAIRFGYPIGEQTWVFISVENLSDRNYRIHGSGVDGAGRGGYVAVRYAW
jgi:outer membrane receptor protein involved in Fe transport